MKRLDFRILLGAALVLLGILLLLDRFGIFHGAADLFWGVVFLAGGAYFIYRFADNMHGEWWAAIPGFALVGLGVESLLPRIFESWSGFFFLGFLGLGFLVIYLSGRERWWALIPGGVLLTLGFVSVLNNIFGGRETGGFFFLGLGLTFLLVAILASMQWAYIPAVILLILGALLGTPFVGALNFIWPTVLILGGLILIFQFLRHR